MKNYKTKNMNLQLFGTEEPPSPYPEQPGPEPEEPLGPTPNYDILNTTVTISNFPSNVSNISVSTDFNTNYYSSDTTNDNMSYISYINHMLAIDIYCSQGTVIPDFTCLGVTYHQSDATYDSSNNRYNYPISTAINGNAINIVFETPQVSSYDSTITLTNCTCTESSDTNISGPYNATITANSGFYISSVETSLGTATIQPDKHTATIDITNVTANFTITGVASPVTYKNVELSPDKNGAVDYTTVLLPKAMSDSSKQDTLTTAQMTAVNSGITSTLVGQIGTNQSNISGIQELIPNQATTSNQLADKEFVNSSIATNTANFIGTFANITALNNYVGTITNNDYANVVNQQLDFATTTEMNNYSKALLTNYDYGWVVNGVKYDLYRFDIETQTWGVRATNISKGDVTLITAYNRYTYNGNLSQWNWNYTINTSGFTAAQWAAINSGATLEQIQKIGSVALTTTAQDLSGAVNELNSSKSQVTFVRWS